MQVVKSAGLDEGLYRALIKLGLVHAHAKVIHRSKQPTLFARRDHGRNGLLAGALDGAQAVADALVGDGLEAVVAAVDVRRLKADAHFDGVAEQHLEFVGVVHLHRHVGAEKLRRVMHLEPGRVVRQQRVGRGVRLVEAIAGKALHQVKDFIGLDLVDSVLGCAIAKDLTVLGHLVGVFFAHGTAQHVSAAQGIAAQNLCGLHHLLLVDHDAVSLRQHPGHQRVRVDHFFAALFARHKGRYQIHRAGAEQGIERDQVFQARGARVLEHALHAAAFKLEHGLGFAFCKKAVHLGVVERQVFKSKIFLAGVALHDELARNL